MTGEGKIIIITGYPASGKDSVVSALVSKLSNLSPVITHTSRPPRPGEKDGVDHHFVSKQEFEHLVADKEIVEFVTHGSHYKGTSRSEFQKVLDGKSIVWRIDMKRTASLESFYSHNFDQETADKLIERTIKILIKAEGKDELLKRYKYRDENGFDKQEFEKRYEQDHRIWLENKDRFPHVVINKSGKLEETVDEIIRLINNS